MHGVAEEPDRQPLDAGQALARDVGRDLAPLDGLVLGRREQLPESGNALQLVLAPLDASC
jgi:hypothetical protein